MLDFSTVKTKYPQTYRQGRMPILTKNHLALKFQQNWLEKHPNDVLAAPKEGGLDDSLTSLNWLHNLNIMTIGNPTPPASPQPTDENKLEFKVNPNQILNVSYVQPPKIDQKFAIGDIVSTLPSPLDKINYKTNPYVKPPYSYATLICMAMKESKKSKITLSSIYNWITDNFMYYRLADPSWQNSIRHNLSLNKCFQKVPRRKDEPGKGGFWRINPEYSDMFVNGIIKKRRGSTLQENSTPSTPTKRPHDIDEFDEPAVKVKVERIHGAEDDILLNGDVSWDSLLNQDIMVNGVRIKTEQIIDDDAYGRASPVMAMSPPSSDTNSDDIDDIFGCDFGSDTDDTKENQTALDLSVNGIKIEPPEWWTDSMNTAALREFMSSPHPHSRPSSGLNTPIAPSPVPDHELAHPWATDRNDLDDAMAAFDIENLFDMTNIPSPLAL